MNELALFAGAGGGILGGHLLGWRTVCAVERDAHSAQLLAQRQNDRTLRPFPIWSDVRSFDGRPWRGIARVVSAGFPCQDISAAGKGRGIDGERSGLWQEARRIISDVEPDCAWLENSPMLTSRGLGRVLGDLAEMGFDAEWGVLSAREAGFDHLRKRIWILAAHPERGKWRDEQHDGAHRRVGGGSSNPLRGTVIGSMCLPEFEEMVMGWPIGWTALTPYATDKFRAWLSEHGENYPALSEAA